MTALLDLPAIRERMASISVESYHRLGQMPVELLKGAIIRKMAKSPLHQLYVDRVRTILFSQLPEGCALRQEGPLTFADSEPEPDVAIVAGAAEDYERTHPTIAILAVEVAVSSLEIDRIKAQIYAEAGVREYWIVCPEEKRVEVYRHPSPEGYRDQADLSAPASLCCAALPGIGVSLAILFR
jgi:Uma2 family endonuclease